MTTIAGVQIKNALDVRKAARSFYPGCISLQRKWVAAWRRAPGARVPIGKRNDDLVLQLKREQAIEYLRTRGIRA